MSAYGKQFLAVMTDGVAMCQHLFLMTFYNLFFYIIVDIAFEKLIIFRKCQNKLSKNVKYLRFFVLKQN